MRSRFVVSIAVATIPCLNAFSSSVPESLLAAPYSIVALEEADPANIVFVDGDHAVVKNLTYKSDTSVSESMHANDWYVVNTSKWPSAPGFVRSAGLVSAQVSGGFAVVEMTVHAAEKLSSELHRSGMACGALVRLTDDPVSLSPVAAPVPVVPIDQQLSQVVELGQEIDATRIEATIEELSAVTTRYYSSPTGIPVADWVAEKYLSLSKGRADITVSKYDHSSVRSNQSSVVVKISGTTRPEEIIVLGSHIDSVNWQDGSSQRSPGADDNASGTATNLEIFRVLIESGARFDRTVEIHAYAAEEIGLVGSAHIAKDYRAAGKNVIAMVQHDMNLYKEPGAPDKIWFVRENTDDSFNNMLAALIDRYVGIPWAKGSLTAGSSDHASWRRKGYATAFPFEHPGNYNPHIHSAQDDTSHANAFSQTAAFAKLGAAYLAHFAGIQ